MKTIDYKNQIIYPKKLNIVLEEYILDKMQLLDHIKYQQHLMDSKTKLDYLTYFKSSDLFYHSTDIIKKYLMDNFGFEDQFSYQGNEEQIKYLAIKLFRIKTKLFTSYKKFIVLIKNFDIKFYSVWLQIIGNNSQYHYIC